MELRSLIKLGGDLCAWPGSASLMMTDSGLWYVDLPGVQRKTSLESPVLTSGVEFTATPEEAVLLTWKSMTALGVVAVIDIGGKKRRIVRWNGVAWEHIREMECR